MPPNDSLVITRNMIKTEIGASKPLRAGSGILPHVGRVQPLLLPPLVGFSHVFAPIAVPAIAVASIGSKIVKTILRNAVSITEERAIGIDLIEPRPKRRGIRVFDHNAADFGLPYDANPCNLR